METVHEMLSGVDIPQHLMEIIKQVTYFTKVRNSCESLGVRCQFKSSGVCRRCGFHR